MKKLLALAFLALSACNDSSTNTPPQRFNVLSWWSVSSGPNESVDPQFIRGMHPTLIAQGWTGFFNMPGWDDQKTLIEREVKFNTNNKSDGVVFWLPFGHYPDEDFDFASYTDSLKDSRLSKVTDIGGFVHDFMNFLQVTKLKKVYFYYGYVGAHPATWNGLTPSDKKSLILKNLEPIKALKEKASAIGVKVGVIIDTLSQRNDPNDDNWTIAIPVIKSLGLMTGGEPWPSKPCLTLEDPNFLNVFLAQSTWLFDPDFDTTHGTWNTWSAPLKEVRPPLSAIEFRDWSNNGYTDTPAIFLDKMVYGLKKYHSIAFALPDDSSQTAESLKKLATQDGTNCITQQNIKSCCTSVGMTLTCSTNMNSPAN